MFEVINVTISLNIIGVGTNFIWLIDDKINRKKSLKGF